MYSMWQSTLKLLLAALKFKIWFFFSFENIAASWKMKTCNVLEMANRTAKRSEIWGSGLVME